MKIVLDEEEIKRVLQDYVNEQYGASAGEVDEDTSWFTSNDADGEEVEGVRDITLTFELELS